MKKVFLFLWAFIYTCISFAQKNYVKNWIINNNGGILFNKDIPDTIYKMFPTGDDDFYESTATISDPKNGDLLFFTTGTAIFNRNFRIMPNGDSLLGCTSSTNGALIIPFPENNNLYYIFTAGCAEDSLENGLRYSLVDITLNGGLGDVVKGKKNILLFKKAPEKITGIRHANKKDYWVIAPKWDSDEYYVYYLDNNDITNTYIYHSGFFYKSTFPTYKEAYVYYSAATGAIKSSIGGKFIAVAYSNYGIIMLLRFNNFNGVIYDSVLIDLPGEYEATYGIAFSPDETKLYVSRIGKTELYQFSLKQFQVDSILNSMTLINTDTTNQNKQMQLGPDLKIYLSSNSYQGGDYLNVIQTPNAEAFQCNYTQKYIQLSTKCELGLPNFVDSWLLDNDSTPAGTYIENHIQKQRIEYILYPNPSGNEVDVRFKGNNQCKDIRFRVYDILGQEIFLDTKIEGNHFRFDSSFLLPGIYIYSISSNDQCVGRGKFIIE